MYVLMYDYIYVLFVCRVWLTYIDINALAQGIKSVLASMVLFQAVAGARIYGTDSLAITRQPRYPFGYRDIHVCMYVCMCMHVYVYVCMYVCVDACMYVCMYVCEYVYICMCAYVRTYLYTKHILFTVIWRQTYGKGPWATLSDKQQEFFYMHHSQTG